uniref:Uncharacterized protein n=1 Tax=Populus alba TaxID=43335 RepID=A0A4U5P569_POPAL|nr:hypothetical protein D5086_0000222980 [Populus alba]
MEGFPPSSMDELTEFDLESLYFQSEDPFNMSELLSPADVNQGSISCNDQGGQNNVVNDSIQQTTQFPISFPETMPGHGYMTPNATTSEHGGFIQPGPSFPAPRSQYFSNQGQVDRAAVIPNIDNVQQENFVPRRNWKGTKRSSGCRTRSRGREDYFTCNSRKRRSKHDRNESTRRWSFRWGTREQSEDRTSGSIVGTKQCSTWQFGRGCWKDTSGSSGGAGTRCRGREN